MFSSFKKAGGAARPCVRARLGESELAGTVTARSGRRRGDRGAGTPSEPHRRHPAWVPGPRPVAPRTHAPKDISTGRAALSPGRRASAGRGLPPGHPAGAAAPAPLLPPRPLLLLPAAWMPSTRFPVPSKFPLGPPAAVCGIGETLGPAPPARGTMKSAEEGKPARPPLPPRPPPRPRPQPRARGVPVPGRRAGRAAVCAAGGGAGGPGARRARCTAWEAVSPWCFPGAALIPSAPSCQ